MYGKYLPTFTMKTNLYMLADIPYMDPMDKILFWMYSKAELIYAYADSWSKTDKSEWI